MKERTAEVLLDVILGILIGMIIQKVIVMNPFSQDEKTVSAEVYDYSIDTNMDTILKIQKSKWKNLNEDERLETVRAIAKIEAVTYLGYTALDFKVESSPDLSDGVLGLYNPSTKTIYIDTDLFGKEDPRKTVSVMLHELAHMIQHRYVDIYKTLDDEDRNLLLFQDIGTYSWEFSNYKSSQDTDPAASELYRSQLCEQDARKYAEERTEYYYTLISDQNKQAKEGKKKSDKKK